MRHPGYYHVYKRGDVYRIARPGILFWHWYKELLHFDLSPMIYQTDSYEDAMAKCVEVNDEIDAAFRYRKDVWTIEGTG